jgi:hypothetical protein
LPIGAEVSKSGGVHLPVPDRETDA